MGYSYIRGIIDQSCSIHERSIHSIAQSVIHVVDIIIYRKQLHRSTYYFTRLDNPIWTTTK